MKESALFFEKSVDNICPWVYTYIIRNSKQHGKGENDMKIEYLIKDIDCTIIVEKENKKEILSWMDEYLENMKYEWFDGSEQMFHILYKDGSYDCINEDYDGHKVKRTNIASIVYDNPCTSMVYGNYEINEYGVVTTSLYETVINENIKEV